MPVPAHKKPSAIKAGDGFESRTLERPPATNHHGDPSSAREGSARQTSEGVQLLPQSEIDPSSRGGASSAMLCRANLYPSHPRMCDCSAERSSPNKISRSLGVDTPDRSHQGSMGLRTTSISNRRSIMVSRIQVLPLFEFGYVKTAARLLPETYTRDRE